MALFVLTIAANAQCASGYTQLSNVFACQLNSGGPVTVFSDTLSGNSPQGGLGARVVIPVAALSAAPGTTSVAVKLSTTSATLAGAKLVAYIGEAAASGDAWAFDGNQVQLKWSGATTFTTTAGAQSFTSDAIPFTYSSTKKLIVEVVETNNVTLGWFVNSAKGTSGYYCGPCTAGASDPSYFAMSQQNAFTAQVSMQ